jgi:two-component system, LuxR family, response regulator FixJ
MRTGQELSAPALVVVIDDDVGVRASLRFLLEFEGFMVHSCASAAEFLSTDDVARCRCLVVDQNMPGMSGLDLIAQLCARHASAPAILIASDPNLSVREPARKAATPIVEKPPLGNALCDRIPDAVANGHG